LKQTHLLFEVGTKNPICPRKFYAQEEEIIISARAQKAYSCRYEKFSRQKDKGTMVKRTRLSHGPCSGLIAMPT